MTVAPILLAILPATGSAQVRTLYMPVSGGSASMDAGLALSNPTLEPATAILTARSYSGALIQGPSVTNPKTLSLPPQSQTALRAVEIFGAGISEGWVEVRLSSPDVLGFFLLFDSGLNFLDGDALAAAPSNQLIFPKVTSDPSLANRLTWINTSDKEIRRVAVSLFENSGRLVSRGYFPLPAYAAFSGSVRDLFGDLEAFDGYAVVETIDLPQRDVLVGSEMYRYGSDIAVLNAMKESSRLRTGYLPHFASQGGYYSTLVLVNFGVETQNVRITAQFLDSSNQSMTPLSVTVERSIPESGRIEERVDQMFGFSGDKLITGYIQYQILGSGSGLSGYLEFRTTDGVLLSAVTAQGQGYSDLWFSHVAEGAGYYTGLAFLNANNESSLVTVDTLDVDGRHVASTALLLRPGERLSRLLRELSPATANQLGGSVHVTASHPVLAFQLFGTDSLSVLANVPAQGSMLWPQEVGRKVSSRDGASVVVPDGSAYIAIPPHALSDDTVVEIKSVSPSDLPTPSSGERIAGAVEALPIGAHFDIPVRLTFPLDSPLPPNSVLPMLTLQPSSGQYERSEFVAIISPSGRAASADVSHFSVFAVADMPSGSGESVKILGLSPATGVSGTTVTISGSGFNPKPEENAVMFAGTENTYVTAKVLSATATNLQVTVPQGAVTGKVFVGVDSVISNGLVFTLVDPIQAPAVTAITPSAVPVGEVFVTVSVVGTGFNRDSVVLYDDVAIPSAFVDSTQLRLTLQGSQLVPGIHRLAVSNISRTGIAPDGGVFGSTGDGIASNELDFAVANPAPSISSIVSGSARVGAQTRITIGGLSFVPSSTVQVDGSPVDTTYVNQSTLIATIPSSQSAFRLVTVMNPTPGGGLSNAVLFLADARVNQPPVVVAGASQTVRLPATANLSGAATDDGLPEGSALAVTWSKVSGTGTVTFSSANALNTGAAFSVAGTYVLRLTVSDGELTSSADVTITVYPPNQAPIVSAGPNQGVTLPASATLYGTWTDDGLPEGSTVTVIWSKVSGPGTVTFSNPNAVSTTVTFSAAGQYVLRLTASDGDLSSSADTTITVNLPLVNQPPVVSAGPNQTITFPTANLSGTATDDGLPLGRLTATWSLVSGPGTVRFGNPSSLSTTATFSVVGKYVLRLTVSDGVLSSSSNVTITVTGPNQGANQAPIVSAGTHQAVTLLTTASLTGTAIDDGLPLGSTLTVTWSKVSGPGTVAFGNASAPSTTAAFSAPGAYVLRLTATDGVLSSNADVTVVVNGTPITDSASHLPPTSGPYAYATFKPGTPGFPALGQTYVDPVFGSTIRRISDLYPADDPSGIYEKNGWWNADSTLFANIARDRIDVIDASSGAVFRSDIPSGDEGFDASFDPVNPSVWYYYSDASLLQFNIQTGVSSTVKTFPAALESLGGSVDWIDRTGRYFLVNYGKRIHVWDKQTDTIYAGSIDVTTLGINANDLDGGWAGITPSGNYVVVSTTPNHYSFAINHATRSLSSSSVLFWTLCGDHGDLISATNGKDYFITSECHDISAVMRVDITLVQTGDTQEGINKQIADNTILLDTGWNGGADHYSCATKGPNQDWCYISMDWNNDTFTDMGPWEPYKQEIIMVDVVAPYTVQRLAHHRSRQLSCLTCDSDGYFFQPRVSASWDGLRVAWASNQGYDSRPAEYADLYVLETPAMDRPLVSPLSGSGDANAASVSKGVMRDFSEQFQKPYFPSRFGLKRSPQAAFGFPYEPSAVIKRRPILEVMKKSLSYTKRGEQ